MSQTFDELNALWQAEVDALNRSVQESQRMIESLLEGQRAKDKVWVVVSESHIMDAPCVNVCSTEDKAVSLVYEMWDIWINNYHAMARAPAHQPATSDLDEPVEVHQGKMYTFEDHLVDWEYNEWHYVYEVEIDHG
jgi:hypothetical protein